MFNKELLIGISTLFGWTPSLILSLASLFSVFTGFVGALNGDWLVGLLLIAIGIAGILGFIALTSVCWGLKLDLRVRFAFLLCGITSLSIVVISGFSGQIYWFTLNFSWVNIYIYVCPLTIGVVHACLHLYFFRKDS